MEKKDERGKDNEACRSDIGIVDYLLVGTTVGLAVEHVQMRRIMMKDQKTMG